MAENNTNVRSESIRQGLVRSGLKLASALSPPLAARLAERLFLTPPRHAAPPRERAALLRADAFALRVGRRRLRAWRFGDGPAVLLAHGWGGRAGQMVPIASALAEAGCAAVVFDGPAHGSSGGRIASAIHFAEALLALAERTGARAAVGHSMGGAAVSFAILLGLELDAAALIGSPRTPETFLGGFSRALSLSPDVEDGVRRRLERRFGMPMEQFDLVRHPGTARARTPLLVVHDREDDEVPFADGEAIAAAWPEAALLPTDGLGHRRILRDRAVLAAVVEHVTARLPRCGCGRLAGADGDGEHCAGCALERELISRPRRAA